MEKRSQKISNQDDLFQITTDRFVAGVIVRENTVIEAAPICRWMIGKTLEEISDYWREAVKKL